MLAKANPKANRFCGIQDKGGRANDCEVLLEGLIGSAQVT